MYAKRIIPCLDVKNGRVVKGVSFVNIRDAGDPVECAIEYNKKGADYFVKQHIESVLNKDREIDTIIFGCTHYPLLIDKIRAYTPKSVKLISQGEYVAKSLKEYLSRHQPMNSLCSKNSETIYCTTESAERFENLASFLLNESISAKKINLKTRE